MKNFIRIAGCLLLTLAVGGVSGYLTRDSITSWYAGLNKPVFNPPNYVFGPVWTLLYILMGISFSMIIALPPSKMRSTAMAVFAAQLVLNFMWSIIFFNLHAVGLAVAEIAVLWIMILWMIIIFRQLKPIAGYLQIPYLSWVSFASALNVAILVLN